MYLLAMDPILSRIAIARRDFLVTPKNQRASKIALDYSKIYLWVILI